MLTYRLLRTAESAAAAALHRRAGVLIPGYDTDLHTPEEDRAFYAGTVMRNGPVWGAFEGDILRGHVALQPGWLDHLYVEPALHGQGIGSALLAIAQRDQDDLQLYTFQANARARALYERFGFVAVDFSDGERNEEKMPDVLYRWRRP